MTPTQSDHYNRLQWFMICLGTKGKELTAKMRIKSQCSCEIKTFELLHMYWSVLLCYDPDDDDNCLTQLEVNTIWDKISRICGISFAPYGSTYVSYESGCGDRAAVSRITEDGVPRITEGSVQRTLGCGISNITFDDGIDYMYITTGTPSFTVR